MYIKIATNRVRTIKVALTDIKFQVRNVTIGLKEIERTMAITKRVANNRFLKSKRSKTHPTTYPGITKIIGKIRKAICDFIRS
jgi:hypothetical protein